MMNRILLVLVFFGSYLLTPSLFAQIIYCDSCPGYNCDLCSDGNYETICADYLSCFNDPEGPGGGINGKHRSALARCVAVDDYGNVGTNPYLSSHCESLKLRLCKYGEGSCAFSERCSEQGCRGIN